MAGSSTTTTRSELRNRRQEIVGEYVKVAWTADDSDGSVPDTTLNRLRGFIVRVKTNPGATAPTDDYDLSLEDSDGDDVLVTLLNDRDTADSEFVTPSDSSAPVPIYVNGNYTLALANNSVNSATGSVEFWILDVV